MATENNTADPIFAVIAARERMLVDQLAFFHLKNDWEEAVGGRSERVHGDWGGHVDHDVIRAHPDYASWEAREQAESQKWKDATEAVFAIVPTTAAGIAALVSHWLSELEAGNFLLDEGDDIALLRQIKQATISIAGHD